MLDTAHFPPAKNHNVTFQFGEINFYTENSGINKKEYCKRKPRWKMTSALWLFASNRKLSRIRITKIKQIHELKLSWAMLFNYLFNTTTWQWYDLKFYFYSTVLTNCEPSKLRDSSFHLNDKIKVIAVKPLAKCNSWI